MGGQKAFTDMGSTPINPVAYNKAGVLLGAMLPLLVDLFKSKDRKNAERYAPSSLLGDLKKSLDCTDTAPKRKIFSWEQRRAASKDPTKGLLVLYIF